MHKVIASSHGCVVVSFAKDAHQMPFPRAFKRAKWKYREPAMNIESTAVPIPKNTNRKMRISDNFFYLVHVSEVDARKESNEKAFHKRKFKTI